MKKTILSIMALSLGAAAMAADHVVCSPDGRLQVTVSDNGGKLTYKVEYEGTEMLAASALGLSTNIGDFSQNLKLVSEQEQKVDKTYEMTRTKASKFHYQANSMTIRVENSDKIPMELTMNVANNSVAYRYRILRGPGNNPKCAVIERELSSFNFPQQTTTFLSPQSKAMIGWERTKPSYEEEYTADAPMTARSQYGEGYTFPCLYRVGNDGWALVSETGVTGKYVGSCLSDWQEGKGYTIKYPMQGENNGWGSTSAAISLPGYTPWRTITIGKTLKPIVESTVQFDVVDPLYEPKYDYKPGRYTWSWLIWQDNSANYEDQKTFVDLAAQMGYEYTLVDGLWDEQMGRDKLAELSRYAQSKGVRLLVWYNSNGAENNAPQGPRDIMDNPVTRKKEMAWLQSIGVAGLKVDFFGGDKQNTMQLYEAILSDANDYGLQIIFHGCTLPRGWERMYPNYVSSEAALASENVFFTDHHAKREAFEMTMHPYARNAVGSFDWGGVMMNRHFSKDNKTGHPRYTSDIFEMATAITNQASVNCVEVTPQAMPDINDFEMEFLRQIPTTWEDTRFIDGYPTKYVVMARLHDGKWYVAGLNAESEAKTLTLSLPMLAGKTVRYYTDQKRKKGELVPVSELKTLKVGKDGKAKVTMQPDGGFILM